MEIISQFQNVLFIWYNMNNIIKILSDKLPTKYLPKGTKVLIYLIAPVIKRGSWSNFYPFTGHCANGSSQVQGVDFDKYYIPVVYVDPFSINVAISEIHRIYGKVYTPVVISGTNIIPIEEILKITTPICTWAGLRNNIRILPLMEMINLSASNSWI